MEVTNCKDINGNSISEITLNDDGTVLAVLEVNGVNSTSKLSSECCTNNGYTFDPMNAKCYWSTTCNTGGTYKIILDPEGTSGALFQIDDNQIGDCTLEVEFDYLLKFDCATMTQSLEDTIESLKLELSLEKVIYDETLPIPNNLESVQKEDILNVDDISLFLSGNSNTGLLLDGDCDSLRLNFINSLPIEEQDRVTETSFNSTWVRHKMIVNDPDILASIYNEYLKIVIIGNNLFNFSFLIDNIKLNRVCESEVGEVYLKDECPSFDLKRVIDNKKSWVGEENTELREFDLSRRETSYSINHEKLSINTKEIDLLINPSNAIGSDVFTFVSENPCILNSNPISGCTGDTHNCVDMTEVMTIPLEEITDSQELLNQLIDVKTRKTLSAYPLIELLYYRYINSEAHCGAKSNALSSESIETFVDLVASFWSDIIEQVVPATTIWGSSYQHSNNVFGSGKFVYKKSTMNLCSPLSMNAPSPTISTYDSERVGSGNHADIEVTTIDVTDTEYFGPLEFAPAGASQKCTGAYIIQTNDGSEFLGTITIIGGTDPTDPTDPTSGNTITGNTITLNETIIDNCNIYNNGCEDDKLGDFSPQDYNNNDWHTPNRT